MRLLRTLIMGSVMLIPGLLLSMLLWYILGQPNTEPMESLICNGIPLLSISLGLFFGWKTGEAYSVKNGVIRSGLNASGYRRLA